MNRFALLASAATLTMAQLSVAQTTQPAAQATIPVKRVVLFSSGVGFFQHSGTVDGSAVSTLNFKAAQINDVLKSLVLLDHNGGTVASVTYPSQDPVDRKLKSFQIDITADPSMADLLKQLRGARVTAIVLGNSITGIVLGVETRQISSTEKGPIEASFVSILSGASIRQVALAEISDLKLEDPKLQSELEKALAAVAAARDTDKKPVSINFAGQGQRNVDIGYVVEAPVWKTSYRLMFDEPGQPSSTAPSAMPSTAAPTTQPGFGKASLQGWAIIENQTDNDWDNVKLSLVSGRPISFIEDLYSPIYLQRQTVQPNLFANLRPQVYADALQKSAMLAPAAAAMPSMRAFANNGQTGMNSMQLESVGGADRSGGGGGGGFGMHGESTVVSEASGQDLGDLFSYDIAQPLTLARQTSAMIPIVADSVNVRKVSIFNQSVLSRNPLVGAELKNNTTKHLLGGPLTVLDHGTYAGDAQINDMPPGQERLISYGVDLKMLIDVKGDENKESLVTGKIVKGVLTLTYRDQATLHYEIQNKGDAAKSLVIEQPISQGWTLVDTQEPAEKTDTLYRFKEEVPANAKQELVVTQQITRDSEMAILQTDNSGIDAWVHNGEIAPKLRDALAKAGQLRQAVADTQNRIDADNQQVKDVSTDQQRINQTLRTISQTADLYTRLMKKLDAEETQLDGLHTEIDRLGVQKQQQQGAFEKYVNELEVE